MKYDPRTALDYIELPEGFDLHVQRDHTPCTYKWYLSYMNKKVDSTQEAQNYIGDTYFVATTGVTLSKMLRDAVNLADAYLEKVAWENKTQTLIMRGKISPDDITRKFEES